MNDDGALLGALSTNAKHNDAVKKAANTRPEDRSTLSDFEKQAYEFEVREATSYLETEVYTVENLTVNNVVGEDSTGRKWGASYADVPGLETTRQAVEWTYRAVAEAIVKANANAQ